MAIETFMWPTQVAGQPTTEYARTIREVQFGDGYKQVSESGINSERIKFSYSFRGSLSVAIAIRDFVVVTVLRHLFGRLRMVIKGCTLSAQIQSD